MATFLSKLFKPKWQNRSSIVRLEALKDLNIQLEEDQLILLSLAESDPKIDVRSAAILKLHDTQQLINLHKKACKDTKPLIESKLYDLANAQSLSIFDLILDTNLLTEMIVKSTQSDTFISGLARIEDPEALFKIATTSKTSKLRQAAAELIESETQLNTLLESAKSSDKSVYQITKAKLTKLKSHALSLETQKQNLEKIIEEIELHASTEVLQHYEAKLNNFKTRWGLVILVADTEQKNKYAEAKARCEERILASKKQQALAEDQERLIQTGGDEQEATLYTLTETLKRFRTEPASILEIPALNGLVKTQENRWLEATRQIKVEKSKVKHYQLLMAELRSYLKSLTALSESTDHVSNLISEITGASTKQAARSEQLTKQLKKALNKIEWPSDYAQPELLMNTHKALGHSAELKQQVTENVKEIQNKVDKLIVSLDASLEDKQLKKATKLHKDILRQLSLIGAKQSEKIQNQLSLRVNQLNELRDWQGFASNPRQQALCEAMERLAENHIEPLEKIEKIKEMQKEWKSFGAASDQKLWQRFKTAADTAYEPCKAFFDEQAQLKRNNILKREQIITQVEEFILKNDWENADWKATEKINKQARIEWKEAYPVDFKANKPLQNKFNELVKQFDEKLDQERTKNLNLKQSIVDQAKELIAHEELEQAINQAKSLQQQWQKVGITPHKNERALWSAFREACDLIFARRDKVKLEQREETEKNILNVKSLCDTFENFAQEADKSSLAETKAGLASFKKQLKELPAISGKNYEHQIKRFELTTNQINTILVGLESKQLLLEWKEIQRKSALCRKLFTNELPEVTAEIELEFESQVSLPKGMELSLKELWISVKAKSLKDSALMTNEQARSLCIACELAAGIDSPETDKSLRMQLQVSRLSEGMASSNANQSREMQITAALENWYTKVGSDLSDLPELEARVEKTTQYLLNS